MMGKRIIVDTQISGHHLEYINHIYDGLSRPSVGFTYLCVSVEAVNALGLENSTNLDVITIPSYGKKLNRGRASKEMKFILDLAKMKDVSNVIFLNINPYQESILRVSTLKYRGIKIDGILFSPPHRIEPHRFERVVDRARLRFMKFRKYLQLYLLTLKPCVRTLYLLDDEEGSKFFSEKFNDKFRYLPDPIELMDSASTNSVRQDYGINLNERIILVFGSLSKRKNLEAIIRGFLSSNIPNSVLLVVGNGEEKYVSELKVLAISEESKFAGRVVIRKGFVSQNHLHELFEVANLICIVYRNFYGSSGILGHAAAYRKPVLATNAGLISYLVNKYHLGLTVDPDIKGIEFGIKNLMLHTLDAVYSGDPSYIASKEPILFVRTLIRLNHLKPV